MIFSMEADKKILNNLYSLYNYVARVYQQTICVSMNAFRVVYTNGSCWPNMVFSIEEIKFEEEQLDEICDFLAEKKMSPLILTAENEKLTKLFRTRNFMPVEQWTGMSVELNEPVKKKSLDKGYEIVAFKAGDDISQFTEAVSENLFKSNRLNNQLFQAMLLANKIEMIAAVVNNQIVGTAMIYYDENDIAGLYMVSSNKNYRERGVGTALVNYALNEIAAKEIKTCVLQSTRQAISLYQKAGFEKQSVINLFWKVK